MLRAADPEDPSYNYAQEGYDTRKFRLHHSVELSLGPHPSPQLPRSPIKPEGRVVAGCLRPPDPCQGTATAEGMTTP